MTRASRPYWDDLVAIYRRKDPVTDHAAQDGLAEVLMTIADRSVADQVVDLLFDQSVGSTRILFLRTLTRLRLPDAWDVVERAAQDPILSKEAQHMLHQRSLRQHRHKCRYRAPGAAAASAPLPSAPVEDPVSGHGVELG